MPISLFTSGVAAIAAAGVVSLAVFAGSADAAGKPATSKNPKSVYDFTVKDIDGKTVKLDRYKGKTLLIVNTASRCGNTPQYASLEKLYQKYKGQGLRILAFPANDFGQQEPGSESQIKEFCTAQYKTTFDLFSKVEVKGANQTPLYKYLTSAETNPKTAGDVEWNFAKFLIGRDGKVVNRFKAGTDPLTPDVEKTIVATLK
jgi:glutathione peroxidase